MFLCNLQYILTIVVDYCSYIHMTLPTGFEPMTLWLTATRSTN